LLSAHDQYILLSVGMKVGHCITLDIRRDGDEMYSLWANGHSSRDILQTWQI